MGNCVASSRLNNQNGRKNSCPDQKLLRIIKVDGKVMEYSASILVKDVQLRFHGFGIGVSKNCCQLLPPDFELKTGRTYHLLPLRIPQLSDSQELNNQHVMQNEEKEEGGSKRIKLVLTKIQLQKLLSMNISLEEIISAASGCEEFSERNSRNWKPELDTIFEGNE